MLFTLFHAHNLIKLLYNGRDIFSEARKEGNKSSFSCMIRISRLEMWTWLDHMFQYFGSMTSWNRYRKYLQIYFDWFSYNNQVKKTRRTFHVMLLAWNILVFLRAMEEYSNKLTKKEVLISHCMLQNTVWSCPVDSSTLSNYPHLH